MKIFLLICLATGLGSTEKLDRTYLPPPGSKFSGGSAGDIQVPFDFPKETYSTEHPVEDGTPELELGINRRPKPSDTAQGSTKRPGFTYFQNSYPIPKTTTSYAFTQTTTFLPLEDYEGLDQPSVIFNASTAQESGLSKYPQAAGQTFQQQLNMGHPELGHNYNQYHQIQNHQSTLTPFGGTTLRPQFASNLKSLEYLPPLSSSGFIGQHPSSQDNFGYPSDLPKEPQYPGGQQLSETTGPVINLSDFISSGINNPQTQFVQNLNGSSSKFQYQDAQKFYTPGSIGQNQYGTNQDYPLSTVAPQYQDGQKFSTSESVGPNKYTGNQNIPSSTVAPQYYEGQRLSTPGSVGQTKYSSNQIVPSSTVAPPYRNGYQISTPGSVGQKQYYAPFGGALYYQNGQRFTTTGSEQHGYGSEVPNQQNQLQYPGNQNLRSQNISTSTAAPQYHNGQQLTSSTSEQQNQYLGNQNVPSNTGPIYQDGQRLKTLEYQQGSSNPTVQNQYQYTENQTFPSSTVVPQYQDGEQFVTPVSVQQTKYFENKNLPATAAHQFQNGQRLSTSGAQQGYRARLPTQQNIPESQTFVQNAYQQYPSTTAPQFQQTISPTSESSQQGFTPNKNVNQYPGQSNYNQLLPSTPAPQKLTPKQPQYGNDGVQPMLGTAALFPAEQRNQGTQPSTGYGNQPASTPSGIASKVYGTSPSATINYNQGFPSTEVEVSGKYGQRTPERPQATSDRITEILNYENVLTPEGYSYSYDTSNGIHADETGTVGDGTRAQGGFSYTGDDGKVYSLFYSADENGFQPRGDHLPTPPPIPEAIQRVIEQANKDKESGISDDGSYNDDKYGYMVYDRPLTGLRSRNKTISSVTGADISNAYENRFAEPIKKQSKPEGTITQKDNEEEVTFDEGKNITENDNIDDVEFDDGSAKEGIRRYYVGHPIKHKNFTSETNRANRPKGNLPIKMTVSAKIDLTENRRPVDKSNIIRHPISEKKSKENISDDKLTKDTEDLQGSQNLDDELDLVNYKDDPNSKTEFHGLNKYLPNSKGNIKRPLVRPDGMRQSSLKINKSRRPGNRKTQISQKVIPNEQDFSNEYSKRIPPIKNNVNQRDMDQSIAEQLDTFERDDELGTYKGDGTKIYEEKESEDEYKPIEGFRANKQEPIRFENDEEIKPTRPAIVERYGISQDKTVKITEDETGYEYNVPQKKFNSEGAVTFPTRTSVTEKSHVTSLTGSQTNLRPFMTPNVYGDIEEPTETDEEQYDSRGKPSRLFPGQEEKYSGFKEESDRLNQNPEFAKNERFDSTRKTTTYHTTTTKHYSTTPLPQSGPDVYKGFQKPDQYQTDAFYDQTVPGKDYRLQRPIANQPGFVNTQGRFPTTIYRPNYTIGDKTSAPSGPLAVDGFRRPLSSTNAPGFDITYKPTYPVTQSSKVSDFRPGKMEEKFRPSVGRFGIPSAPTEGTPGSYQGSTSEPIGEDFSGPRQPSRFHPETGYHYK